MLAACFGIRGTFSCRVIPRNALDKYPAFQKFTSIQQESGDYC